jgi:hypothetical protein
MLIHEISIMVHEEWIALQRATIPSALVLWRSTFSHTHDKPFFNNLDITDLSPKWYFVDRGHMPNDPFPFVDPESSPY